MTLIAANAPFALGTVLFAGTAFAFWTVSRRWGRQASGQGRRHPLTPGSSMGVLDNFPGVAAIGVLR